MNLIRLWTLQGVRIPGSLQWLAPGRGNLCLLREGDGDREHVASWRFCSSLSDHPVLREDKHSALTLTRCDPRKMGVFFFSVTPTSWTPSRQPATPFDVNWSRGDPFQSQGQIGWKATREETAILYGQLKRLARVVLTVHEFDLAGSSGNPNPLLIVTEWKPLSLFRFNELLEGRGEGTDQRTV